MHSDVKTFTNTNFDFDLISKSLFVTELLSQLNTPCPGQTSKLSMTKRNDAVFA